MIGSVQNIEADVTLLDSLKSFVYIFLPKIETFQNCSVLIGEEGGQLEHPLPPEPYIHTHPVPSVHTEVSQGMVAGKTDDQLHAALVDGVGGHHLLHTVPHSQAHVVALLSSGDSSGLLPPEQGSHHGGRHLLHRLLPRLVQIDPPGPR